MVQALAFSLKRSLSALHSGLVFGSPPSRCDFGT